MKSHNTTTSLRTIVNEVIAARTSVPRIRATYRVQFNHQFTFADATRLVPYLAQLGVSHLYASPIFRAAPGSMHGYDVVDYGELNPEIGTRAELDELVRALRDHEMGLVVDFVPNHMGIEKGANSWWQDVLENGRMSRFAEYFDIDWNPLKRELRNKVLLPFLGDQYGAILERGELKLGWNDAHLTLHYWDTPFPIDPHTWPVVLHALQEDLVTELHDDDINLLELESIINAFDRLPQAIDHDPSPEEVDARYREQMVTVRRLDDLIQRNPVFRTAFEQCLSRFNGEPGVPESFDALDHLLSLQPYRLSYWRVASEEINYRRFFAINSLAAIRQEDREVFDATHALLMELLVEGALDGVRFDHTDGLWDPERYFHDVQAAYVQSAVKARLQPESDSVWHELEPALDSEIRLALQEIADDSGEWPVWVVAEKILEHDERLPATWKLDGTVGYEFLQAANGVLVNPQSRALLDTIYARYTGEKIRFLELVYDMKLWQVREAFASELNVLTNVANRISESDRHSRDFTFSALRAVLREVIACFGVYRTYTTCREGDVSEHDVSTINAAVDEAVRRNPRLDTSVFEFVREALLLHQTGEVVERRSAPCHFAMKLQQLTGPVMAKGLEDTAFYRFNRLTSLNEVGGDPAKFGTTVSEFHRQNQERLQLWPRSMITSSTHDTKRSEDVRAAISVLSERPTEWRAAINRWTRLNRKFKVKIDGALAPHRVDEWVLYQTLVGTWPLTGTEGVTAEYTSRIQDYMLKVVREAGRFSNWVNPDQAYEAALQDFVAGVLNTRRARGFLADLGEFVDVQRDAAMMNALSQQVMKLTSPGVPDIYQGTELWDDSLVDPDNRRAVDYAHRQELLNRTGLTADLVADRRNGALKQRVTAILLGHRRAYPDLYLGGTYTQIRVNGPAAEHVIAWLRYSGDEQLLVVVPRLLYTLADGGQIMTNPQICAGTSLALPAHLSSDGWTNILAENTELNDSTDLVEIFGTMPLAVLARIGAHA